MPKQFETGNAKDAFLEAESFFHASNAILENTLMGGLNIEEREKALATYYPANVCHSFAVEMYLKCLGILGKDNKFQVTHDHEKLFNNLELLVRNKIIKHYNCNFFDKDEDAWDTVLGTPQKSLVELLVESKDSFKSLRYGVTQEDRKPRYRLHFIIHSIRATILEISPNLKPYQIVK